MSQQPITVRAALSATAAVIALSALTGCSAATSTGNPGGFTGASASASAAAGPGLNTPVTVGSFQFTVLDAQAAGTTVGTAPLTQTAQGQYFKVDLKVGNTGNSSQTFIVNDIKLATADGKTYDADATASLYAAGDAQTWVAAINPGNAVQGPIFFDIPAGVKPATLTVSDNAFTKGTPIRLG